MSDKTIPIVIDGKELPNSMPIVIDGKQLNTPSQPVNQPITAPTTPKKEEGFWNNLWNDVKGATSYVIDKGVDTANYAIDKWENAIDSVENGLDAVGQSIGLLGEDNFFSKEARQEREETSKATEKAKTMMTNTLVNKAMRDNFNDINATDFKVGDPSLDLIKQNLKSVYQEYTDNYMSNAQLGGINGDFGTNPAQNATDNTKQLVDEYSKRIGDIVREAKLEQQKKFANHEADSPLLDRDTLSDIIANDKQLTDINDKLKSNKINTHFGYGLSSFGQQWEQLFNDGLSWEKTPGDVLTALYSTANLAGETITAMVEQIHNNIPIDAIKNSGTDKQNLSTSLSTSKIDDIANAVGGFAPKVAAFVGSMYVGAGEAKLGMKIGELLGNGQKMKEILNTIGKYGKYITEGTTVNGEFNYYLHPTLDNKTMASDLGINAAFNLVGEAVLGLYKYNKASKEKEALNALGDKLSYIETLPNGTQKQVHILDSLLSGGKNGSESNPLSKMIIDNTEVGMKNIDTFIKKIDETTDAAKKIKDKQLFNKYLIEKYSLNNVLSESQKKSLLLKNESKVGANELFNEFKDNLKGYFTAIKDSIKDVNKDIIEGNGNDKVILQKAIDMYNMKGFNNFLNKDTLKDIKIKTIDGKTKTIEISPETYTKIELDKSAGELSDNTTKAILQDVNHSLLGDGSKVELSSYIQAVKKVLGEIAGLDVKKYENVLKGLKSIDNLDTIIKSLHKVKPASIAKTSEKIAQKIDGQTDIANALIKLGRAYDSFNNLEDFTIVLLHELTHLGEDGLKEIFGEKTVSKLRNEWKKLVEGVKMLDPQLAKSLDNTTFAVLKELVKPKTGFKEFLAYTLSESIVKGKENGFSILDELKKGIKIPLKDGRIKTIKIDTKTIEEAGQQLYDNKFKEIDSKLIKETADDGDILNRVLHNRYYRKFEKEVLDNFKNAVINKSVPGVMQFLTSVDYPHFKEIVSELGYFSKRDLNTLSKSLTREELTDIVVNAITLGVKGTDGLIAGGLWKAINSKTNDISYIFMEAFNKSGFVNSEGDKFSTKSEFITWLSNHIHNGKVDDIGIKNVLTNTFKDIISNPNSVINASKILDAIKELGGKTPKIKPNKVIEETNNGISNLEKGLYEGTNIEQVVKRIKKLDIKTYEKSEKVLKEFNLLKNKYGKDVKFELANSDWWNLLVSNSKKRINKYEQTLDNYNYVLKQLQDTKQLFTSIGKLHQSLILEVESLLLSKGEIISFSKELNELLKKENITNKPNQLIKYLTETYNLTNRDLKYIKDEIAFINPFFKRDVNLNNIKEYENWVKDRIVSLEDKLNKEKYYKGKEVGANTVGQYAHKGFLNSGKPEIRLYNSYSSHAIIHEFSHHLEYYVNEKDLKEIEIYYKEDFNKIVDKIYAGYQKILKNKKGEFIPNVVKGEVQTPYITTKDIEDYLHGDYSNLNELQIRSIEDSIKSKGLNKDNLYRYTNKKEYFAEEMSDAFFRNIEPKKGVLQKIYSFLKYLSGNTEEFFDKIYKDIKNSDKIKLNNIDDGISNLEKGNDISNLEKGNDISNLEKLNNTTKSGTVNSSKIQDVADKLSLVYNTLYKAQLNTFVKNISGGRNIYWLKDLGVGDTKDLDKLYTQEYNIGDFKSALDYLAHSLGGDGKIELNNILRKGTDDVKLDASKNIKKIERISLFSRLFNGLGLKTDSNLFSDFVNNLNKHGVEHGYLSGREYDLNTITKLFGYRVGGTKDAIKELSNIIDNGVENGQSIDYILQKIYEHNTIKGLLLKPNLDKNGRVIKNPKQLLQKVLYTGNMVKRQGDITNESPITWSDLIDNIFNTFKTDIAEQLAKQVVSNSNKAIINSLGENGYNQLMQHIDELSSKYKSIDNLIQEIKDSTGIDTKFKQGKYTDIPSELQRPDVKVNLNGDVVGTDVGGTAYTFKKNTNGQWSITEYRPYQSKELEKTSIFADTNLQNLIDFKQQITKLNRSKDMLNKMKQHIAECL